ncbi:MAG: hypothetical protein HYR55_14055 [Acidobacteria bacterium]|nr:hypothetical protein [Acidobacteriota bacterium]MBI3655882.1 hypothetical protein [Acidobacteriota bacterium]
MSPIKMTWLLLTAVLVFISGPRPCAAERPSPESGPENSTERRATKFNYEALLKTIQADAAPVVDKITGRVAVDSKDWLYAAHFSPVFYQGVGRTPRGDYMLKFNYDGDWSGINNWHNLDSSNADYHGYVYFSTAETLTHFFIFYVVFHARDYKRIAEQVYLFGGTAGWLLEKHLWHENDLEGSVVVIKKNGDDPKAGEVVLVETMAHFRFFLFPTDTFLKYFTEKLLKTRKMNKAHQVAMDESHPRLFIEPEGHGIMRYEGKLEKNMMVYRYKAQTENPERADHSNIGYNLIPIYNTFWERACADIDAENVTFGSVLEFTFEPPERAPTFFHHKIQPGKKDLTVNIGVALKGRVHGANKARLPWGWWDRFDRPTWNGSWYFDPAQVVKQQFNLGDDFSTDYIHNPSINIFCREPKACLPPDNK